MSDSYGVRLRISSQRISALSRTKPPQEPLTTVWAYSHTAGHAGSSAQSHTAPDPQGTAGRRSRNIAGAQPEYACVPPGEGAQVVISVGRASGPAGIRTAGCCRKPIPTDLSTTTAGRTRACSPSAIVGITKRSPHDHIPSMPMSRYGGRQRTYRPTQPVTAFTLSKCGSALASPHTLKAKQG